MGNFASREGPQPGDDPMSYAPLREHTSHDGDDLGEELKDALARANDLPRLTTTRAMVVGIISGILAASLMVFMLDFIPAIRHSVEDQGQPLLTPVPHIPATIKTFTSEQIFSSSLSAESNKAWDSLLPAGRGFVYVPNPESYELEPGQKTPWGDIWSVSMYHQLHCLGQIRKHFWELFSLVMSNDPAKAAKFLASGHNTTVEHAGHCFDYLRQAIMCAGDMTLEWPRTEPDGRRVAVDGWNIPHVCKDPSAISNYMDEHHFDRSTNPSIAPGE